MKNFTTLLSIAAIIFLASVSYGYTGLVVDARGLDIMPGMSPTIVDTYGNEIFGTFTNIDPEVAEEEGIVGYAENLADATAGRGGNDPLVVKALANGGDPCRTSVMVDTRDAKKIVEADYQSRILNDMKVVILL